ncbi:MAG TPA: hypothetical protein VEG30_06595 [Terriglobales bacterium]|nr:hypothetical protein [Terriglobales bacterium]
MYRISVVLIFCVLLAACGGGGGSSGNSNSSGGNGGSSFPVGAPTTVTAAAGQPTTGIDITVASPTSSTPPNAEDLGANTQGIASNTGDIAHRGSTVQVILFGPGLSGNMQVTISGPSDITISNLVSIQSTDRPPIPGIQFTAAISSSADLGARTVRLQDTSGNITTFSGGLEVVP